MTRGWCTNTISDEEFYVDDEHPHDFGDGKKRTWWDLRPYMVQVPYQSWVKLKVYIIQQCKKNGGCTENVGTWERKINEMDNKINDE